MAANVGTLMDGTYFVGRNELLAFLNNTLSLNLTKIEQTASGAVACQLLDALHPGVVQLHKVDFNASKDYEFIPNYKVLQNAFSKLGIEKDIPINNLVKAKPLDNMEFMQWMKAYFEAQTGGQGVFDYDAQARRATCKTGDMKLARGKRNPSTSGQPARSTPSSTMARSGSSVATRRTTATRPADATLAPQASRAGQRAYSPVKKSSQADATAIQGLTEEVTELKLKVDNVEKERDFYFDKLRDIEILCQAPELANIKIVKVFERILYAANDVEAKQVIAEAQTHFAAVLADTH